MVGHSFSHNSVVVTECAVQRVYRDCGAGGYAVNVDAVRANCYRNATI